MSLFFSLFLLAFAFSFSLSLFFIYRSLNGPRRRIGCGDVVVGPNIALPGADPSLVLLEILGEEEEEGRVRKKKRRAKKKRAESKSGSGSGGVKTELVCLYPFTSTSSATQRKIKQQYDQLVKCNEGGKGLTLAQVGEFANCLIDARNELQHKSEVIKRKFTIAKALLYKADRSSIERIRQQIYKLELEQKRLEEDAFVYNWLQQQLKLSPAYKKMVELSSCLELKAKSHKLIENEDPDISDISFEELLAQEKKDSFWQKNAKSRGYSS